MRNIFEYPITQEEKRKFIDDRNEGIGSIEPLILQMHTTEFAEWVWTNCVEYMRNGLYSVSDISGLDVTQTYTIEQLYGYWLVNEWLKNV